MASPFNVELTMRRPPSEAQAHAIAALTEPARAIGLRLAKRDAGALHYRPRVQFPFLIMIWHILNREQMTVRFEPKPAGETRVTITGRRRPRQPPTRCRRRTLGGATRRDHHGLDLASCDGVTASFLTQG